jgi:hypothetical protein
MKQRNLKEIVHDLCNAFSPLYLLFSTEELTEEQCHLLAKDIKENGKRLLELLDELHDCADKQ